MTPVIWLLGGTGIVGLLYTLIVIRRARRQTGYRPVAEDWLWHAILPLIAYVTVIGAAVGFPHDAEAALFPVAGAGHASH